MYKLRKKTDVREVMSGKLDKDSFFSFKTCISLRCLRKVTSKERETAVIKGSLEEGGQTGCKSLGTVLFLLLIIFSRLIV